MCTLKQLLPIIKIEVFHWNVASMKLFQTGDGQRDSEECYQSFPLKIVSTDGKSKDIPCIASGLLTYLTWYFVLWVAIFSSWLTCSLSHSLICVLIAIFGLDLTFTTQAVYKLQVSPCINNLEKWVNIVIQDVTKALTERLQWMYQGRRKSHCLVLMINHILEVLLSCVDSAVCSGWG